jgi:hypothetical protein
MTTTAPAAGPAPAPKNLIARFVGIIVSPKETFQTLVPAPRWFAMLALSTVLVAVFTTLPLTTPAGKQAALEQQVQQRQAFGLQTSDEAYAQMERMQRVMPYIAGGGVLVVSPIIVAIFAGILFAIFNAALGGEASFKQVVSIVVHAGVISTASAVLSGAVNYFSGRVGSVTNVGALLPMLPEKSFLANLLGAVDVFLIWWIVVLAIGLGVLYKRRTQPIAISLLAVYAVITLGIAAFKSRGGA